MFYRYTHIYIYIYLYTLFLRAVVDLWDKSWRIAPVGSPFQKGAIADTVDGWNPVPPGMYKTL